MAPADVRRLLLQHYGIRVEENMCQYLLTRLQAQTPQPVAVIGADARTGVPMRREFRPQVLLSQLTTHNS